MRQTEFAFVLPIGYTDTDGVEHRQGVMRMATALDEITPLRDLRVRSNQAYLSIVLLSRVIVRLGSLAAINTSVVENLYAADLAYLQALYRQINEEGRTTLNVQCPHCHTDHEVDLLALGGS